ncbi:TPA: N-6 DNA methylase [Streptococcus suis]|nr:N-6 DNA methylase [Streptococcus suis]HEL1758054.1 N-6 DNA methylase [Streptococcus suis]HEL1761498.1 N-6 DNA methylase [Streptococcus suis]HEL1762571.1 N-6 DNA methylase [Streptococcus suis]
MINLFLLSTDYKNKNSDARNTANDIISEIYTTLQDTDHRLNEIITAWKEDFTYIYGDLKTNISSNAKFNLEELRYEFKLPLKESCDSFEFEDAQLLFFSIQTYFSLLMKSVIKNSLENTELSGDYRNLILGNFTKKYGIENYVNYDWYTWPILKIDTGFDRIIERVYIHLNFYHNNLNRQEILNSHNFDFIKQIYESIVPKSFRHALGEYYTPDWLAKQTLLDSIKLMECNEKDVIILDPTCGSGTFIFKAIELKRQSGSNLNQIINSVKGFDINPLAVLTAKTNYILSIIDLLDSQTSFSLPIYYYDALGSDFLIKDSSDDDYLKLVLESKRVDFSIVENLDKVDIIAGNPPWVNWEYMPEKYRKLNQYLWVDYGLFSAKGRDLSFSKEDISVLITYRVIDKFLRSGGILGFVIRQGVFKSATNGVGFRHFKVDNKFDIKVLKVDDLSKIKVFDNASNSTALFYCKKGEKNEFPISYYVWNKRIDLKRLSFHSYSTIEEVKSQISINEQIAVPAIENEKTSLWLTTEKEKLESLKRVLGTNRYQARTGVFTGGSNAVYWLDIVSKKYDLLTVKNIISRAKRKVEEVTVEIEPLHVYPMIKGSNLKQWKYEYDTYLLCPHTKETKMWPVTKESLKSSTPRTYEYLERFKDNLDSRKGFAGWEKEIQKKEFHSILRVGEYTFSEFKVVWKYIATEFVCAVVGKVDDNFIGQKLVLPNEKVMYISTDDEMEAYYLCGVLSSTLVADCVRSYMNPTSISAHVLDKLNIPNFDNTNITHLQIANACKEGHLDGQIDKQIKIIDKLLIDIYQ